MAPAVHCYCCCCGLNLPSCFSPFCLCLLFVCGYRHTQLHRLLKSSCMLLRQQQRSVRRLAAAGPAVEPVPEQQQQPEQPAAVEQRQVTLRKPVGVVFAQNKGGPVFVEEVAAGGNADKSGAVQVCRCVSFLCSQQLPYCNAHRMLWLQPAQPGVWTASVHIRSCKLHSTCNQYLRLCRWGMFSPSAVLSS